MVYAIPRWPIASLFSSPQGCRYRCLNRNLNHSTTYFCINRRDIRSIDFTFSTHEIYSFLSLKSHSLLNLFECRWGNYHSSENRALQTNERAHVQLGWDDDYVIYHPSVHPDKLARQYVVLVSEHVYWVTAHPRIYKTRSSNLSFGIQCGNIHQRYLLYPSGQRSCPSKGYDDGFENLLL